MTTFWGPAVADQQLDIASVTARLSQLSNEELRQFLTDDDGSGGRCHRLDEMIRELPQIQSMESERDRLIEANRTAAQHNLSREPVYRQKRQQLVDGHRELTALKEEIDEKKSRLDETARQTSLDTRLALMQTATAEAEEQSEDLASAFINSDISFEQFIKEFVDRRKLAHLRRIKTEKMMDCIRRETNNGGSGLGVGGQSLSNLTPLRPAPPPPQQPTLPFSQPGGGGGAGSGLREYVQPPYPVYGSGGAGGPQMMPQMPPQPLPQQVVPQQSSISYPFSQSFR
ncbi:vacuolar protein sorting-associated protein 37B-like [Oppia nitens]|uniref:vacuolar protein sorting-associated protein 37B-like n=1 Tax=Oppia nitens TaxID=1686743 RepID=UPI0023DB89F4|nr:vacuolar protein sorting-associated protein 37B-like [Oppia nitens]